MAGQHRMKEYVEDFKRLSYCERCCCEGGELTTECTGEFVPHETRMKVARKELDYVGGRWIEKAGTN